MESLRGDNPINLKENNRSIKFQILDWVSVNEVIEDTEEEAHRILIRRNMRITRNM